MPEGSGMSDSCIYPAIMYREKGEDKIYIRFPGFPELCAYGDTQREAVRQAQKALAMLLIAWDEEKAEPPEPVGEADIALEVGEWLIYIHVWLPYFRSAVKEVYVKKSVTIPKWLDELARGKELNFSAALVRGLKEELGIGDGKPER